MLIAIIFTLSSKIICRFYAEVTPFLRRFYTVSTQRGVRVRLRDAFCKQQHARQQYRQQPLQD
jgi:hypothetical protein